MFSFSNIPSDTASLVATTNPDSLCLCLSGFSFRILCNLSIFFPFSVRNMLRNLEMSYYVINVPINAAVTRMCCLTRFLQIY